MKAHDLSWARGPRLGQSQVPRHQSLGYLEDGGPTARVEAVIDANNGRPRILYYRDLTELGKAFDLSTTASPTGR